MNKIIITGSKKGLEVIKKDAKKALVELEKKLHIPTDSPIVIRLHETRARYEKQLGRKTEDWEVGNTSADNTIDIIHPNSFEKHSSHPKSDFIKILKHEMTHIFMRKIAGSSAIPRWLNEGISMYVADQVERYQNQRGYYIEEDYAVKLSTNFGWNTYTNYDAYRYACLFTCFLIEKHSLEKILKLLKSLNKNYYQPSFEKKLRKFLESLFPRRRRILQTNRYKFKKSGNNNCRSFSLPKIYPTTGSHFL